MDKKWKKIGFIISFVIIIIRIIYIIVGGEVDKKYVLSAEYDLSSATSISCENVKQTFRTDKERLNSLEIMFMNIADGETGVLELSIYSENELIYQSDISLANVVNNEWKRIYINAEVTEKKQYTINIVSKGEYIQIPEILLVSTGYASEIEASYADGTLLNDQFAINYGYLKFPSLAERIVTSLIWLAVLFFIFLFLKYFEKIYTGTKNIYTYIYGKVKTQTLILVSEFICCEVIIKCSQIEFQKPTQIIFFIISALAVVDFENKREYIKRLTDSTWKKVGITILYLYAAFSLVGQRLFIYPLNSKITVAGLVVYVFAVLWFIPVLNSVLFYLEKACMNSFSNFKKIKTWKFVLICVLLILVPAAFNLYVYNPGISTVDSYSTMVVNAKNLKGMLDWHPAFYCILLNIIETVWDSTYAVILCQYIFYVYVVIELILYLRHKNIKDSVLIAITAFIGFNASNYIQVNTIWKDIPYAFCLLWSIIIIGKLSIDFEEYKKKWYIYLEMIICFVGMYFLRKNGVVPFVIISLGMIIFLRKNIKIWCSLAICILLIVVIRGPIYKHYEVVSPGRVGMYIGLSQDILGVYYSGGEVSESTLQMINVMTDYNNASYVYTPTWAYQSYNLTVKPGKFIFNYLDTFIKNPIIMSRAVIAREDALWNIYKGQDGVLGCVNVTSTLNDFSIDGGADWNDYYPKRRYVNLYTTISRINNYIADSQWLSAIIWRCGIFTLMGISALFCLIMKRGANKYLIIVTPVIGHILSLMLSTGWSDFRYFWPANLLNLVIILFTVVIKGTDIKDDWQKEQID